MPMLPTKIIIEDRDPSHMPLEDDRFVNALVCYTCIKNIIFFIFNLVFDSLMTL